VLKSAGKLLPEWELHGFDLNDKHRAEILSLPGVASFVSGSLSKLPMTEFDLVVLWQTLEHIPDALSTLLEMKSLLRPSGMLLVQVPDLARNYFDLLVIDHCSHFTFETFLTLCRRAGLAVRQNGTPWIHNCLTVLLDRTETEETICAPKLRPEAYLAWVRNAIRQFEEATRASDYVLFGTGMASIAMLRQLSRRPVCIMEEDEQRVGGTLDNLLIRSPADAPPALKVVMPFVTSTGAEIARRLQQSFGSSKGWEFVVPQDIPQSEAARGGSFQPA
jgi:hypothetical protein